MSSESFLDAIEDENRTELSRLGSSKALYAETSGDMDAENVLRAAAVAEDAARETFEAWADDEGNEAAADLFAALAAEEADHYETVAADLDDAPQAADAETPAIQRVLRGFDDTVERAGGLVGRCLVAKRSKEQYTGYFVGAADPQTADVFREVGSDVNGQLDRAVELVEDVCDDDADRERAEAAASDSIRAAYEEYVEALESMGVNPKPVC